MSEQGGPDCLALLEHDHQVINEQLVALSRALHEAPRQPESPGLQESLRKLTRFFTTDLPAHIRVEEEALFPALIPQLGQTHGPLVAIRLEH